MYKCLFLFLAAVACSSGKESDPNNPFTEQRAITRLEHELLEEASGLEASLTNPGYLWSHNDSGGRPEIYLLDKKGQVVFTVELNGVENLDWEEIVTATVDRVNYLFIGDIGDNKAVRDHVYLLRIREPRFVDESRVQVPFDQIDIMTFQYAEDARDAETLMYDPRGEEFILITKREKRARLYAFPFDTKSETVTITSKGKIKERNFTAGDINHQGEILLKTYDEIYYFPANDDAVIDRILKWDPIQVTYEPEPQGEALCWEGDSFYTLSERKKKPQELLVFERK